MNKISTIFKALCIFSLFIANCHVCHAKSPVGKNNTRQAQSKQHLEKDIDQIPHVGDWRKASYNADNLIDSGKYDTAENILNSLLPQARKEAPSSVDLALALCRSGSALYAQKEYPLALSRFNESLDILSHSPGSARQRSIMWRSMASKAATLIALKKNTEAEALARKSLAYSIAFPEIATAQQVKIAYQLLGKALVAQDKYDQATKIHEIMNKQ